MLIWYAVCVKALEKLDDGSRTTTLPISKPSTDCAQPGPLQEDSNSNCSQICSMSQAAECVCTQPQEVPEGVAQEDLRFVSSVDGRAGCSGSYCEQDIARSRDEEASPAEIACEYDGTELVPEYTSSSALTPVQTMVLDKIRMPRPAAITIHDRVTATVISVKTSLLERPPVTVTQTRMQNPVTTTLPPLVLRIPTTIVKISRPETVTRVIPPQMIYHPPITSTIHHQIQYPASTVVLNSTLPSIVKTVTVPSPPLTVVRVFTKTVYPKTMHPYRLPVPKMQFPHGMSPQSLNDNILNSSRISYSPFFGYTPEDNRLLYGAQNNGFLFRGNGRTESAYPQALNPPIYPLFRSAKSGLRDYERSRYDFNEFSNPAQKDDYDPFWPRQRSGSKCIWGTNDCYTSMLSSNFELPRHESSCSESNIMRCAQKYPDIIRLSEDPPEPPRNNERDVADREVSVISRSNRTKIDRGGSDRSLLVSRESDVPKIIYMSELIQKDE